MSNLKSEFTLNHEEIFGSGYTYIVEKTVLGQKIKILYLCINGSFNENSLFKMGKITSASFSLSYDDYQKPFITTTFTQEFEQFLADFDITRVEIDADFNFEHLPNSSFYLSCKYKYSADASQVYSKKRVNKLISDLSVLKRSAKIKGDSYHDY